MRRYLPTLNAVRAFEAAGRKQSFTGAAAELNITHSAISRHVRGLEKQLGVQLFRIIPRGVELTDHGKAYLSAISPALEEISEASQKIKDSVSSTISISCEPTFAAKWLMQKIGSFRTQYPEINLALEPSPDVIDFRSGKFDLAIRHCTRDYDGLAQILIFKENVYPYGSPSKKLIGKPNDLNAYRLLHEDYGELWSRWFSAIGESKLRLRAKPNPQTALLAIEEAIAGNGIVLTSPEIADADVRAGRLKRLSNIGLHYGGYYVVYPEHTKQRSSEIDFCNWLLSQNPSN